MAATNVRYTERIGAANDNWLMTADGDPTTGDGLPSGVGSWLATPDGFWQKTGAGDTDWSLGTLVAAAGTLTGTTLASNVVTSSLTTIGTLVAGAVPASLVTPGTFGAGDYVFPANLAVTTALTIGTNPPASTAGLVVG